MPRLGHAVKSRLPRFLRFTLEAGQRFGFNLTPNHFYSDVPDLRQLRASTYWRKPYSMYSVCGAAIEPQLAFVERIVADYTDRLADHGLYEAACAANGEAGYGPIEGAFLYCYIRAEKPRRIVQVGCGVSTALILQAVRDESGYQPQITCVEPHPTPFLQDRAAAGDIALIPKIMQEVPHEQMTDLGEGGLLFVDSSHSLRIGSEVIQIINEIMPRLVPGTRVHFHDIPFPYDYLPATLGVDVFFPREPALLYAYLAGNPRCTIEASMSMLHHERLSEMVELFPAFRPMTMRDGLEVEPGHAPSAVFLRVT